MMRLWQKLRGLFRRRSGRSGIGVELRQSDLRFGRFIRPERVVCHHVTIVFARGDVDDATFRLLGERQMWKRLLEEDRRAAVRDDDQPALDDFSLAMLDDDVVATVSPPQAYPPLPLDALPLTTVGYNELVLDLAERCDRALSFTVRASNDHALRVGW